MRVAGQDARSARSVVLGRAPEQFRALFARKYQESFGAGISLQASKQSHILVSYMPANDSLSRPAQASIDNVLGESGQFELLIRLWGECVDALKPLSRKLAQGADLTTREAYEALPEGHAGVDGRAARALLDA